VSERSSISAEAVRVDVQRMFGHRLSGVEPRLPGLRHAVTLRVATRYNSDDVRRVVNGQLRDLSRPASKRWPDAYTFDEEAAEVALQEVAAGARVAAARAGMLITADDEADVAAALADDPAMPLMVEASRTPRPEGPLPLDLLDGAYADRRLATAPAVSSGRFTDWRVLARHEKQMLPITERGQLPDRVEVDEGLVIGRLPEQSDGPMPWGKGRMWVWTEPVGAAAGASPPAEAVRADGSLDIAWLLAFSLPPGPVVGIDAGWRGLGLPFPLLCPYPGLVQGLLLSPAPRLQQGLTLLDPAGVPALVARIWRCCYTDGGDFGPRYPTLSGMDVLLRADLHGLLEEVASKQRLTYLRQVSQAEGSGAHA
jgi:hypothetical protein